MNEWMNIINLYLLEEINIETVLKRGCVLSKHAMTFLWYLRPQGALH